MPRITSRRSSALAPAAVVAEPRGTQNEYWASLTDAERENQLRLMRSIQRMRELRETPLKEWDNLTYTQRYEVNKEADLGFNPLIGDIDERDKGFSMRSGITRYKDSSILSHLASFQFDPAIHAFDKEKRLVVELGEHTADLVKKSREIDGYDTKRYDIYRELIAQGNVFVEEEFVQKLMVMRDSNNEDGEAWTPGQPIASFKDDETPIAVVEEACEANLLLGKYVYLSSLTQPDIQKQAMVATYREISLPEFNRVYGAWDRAEFVRKTVGKAARYKDAYSDLFATGSVNAGTGYGVWGSEYFWNVVDPQGSVGLLKVYEPFSNRFMLMANGVMLLPSNFPLTRISPSGLIPIAKGDAENIPGFAYAKGVPANTYVDEKLYDYVYQAMTKKMLQSAEPTLGNNTGKELPRNWAKPGVAYRGMRSAQLEPLLPEESRTITNSDVQLATLVKDILNDKSVDDSFSGGQVNESTATVYLERQKNTISKLFQVVDGVRALEKQMVRLRIANIYANWTKHEIKSVEDAVEEVVDGIPTVVGTKVRQENRFKEFTVDTKIKDASREGVKIVRFYDSGLPKSADLLAEEDRLSRSLDKPVRVVYLHAPTLSKLFEWHWYIDIIPRDTQASDVKLIAYLDQKARIANLFGPQILNPEYTLQRVAEYQSEDPAKAYVIPEGPSPEDQMAQMQAQMQMAGGAQGGVQNAPSPQSDAVNGLMAALSPR